jgi:hypothetical protein
MSEDTEETDGRRFSDPLLEDFYRDFNNSKKENAEAHERLVAAVKANTVEVRNMREEQSGLMEAWSALGGAVKVAVWIGRFIKWVAGFSFIGVCVAWIAERWPH